MATGDRFAYLYSRKLLPLDQLGPKFLTYLVNGFRQLGQDVFGSDASITSPVAVTASVSVNKIDIAKLNTVNAVTGTGRRILTITNADSRLQGIKIPPQAGVVYAVGIEQNDDEDGIEVNPRTGAYQYLSILEELGRKTAPSSVTVGGGTLTVNVNSLFESGDDHSGRSVKIWLKPVENGGPGPQSPSASIAIQTLTVTFSAPNNIITVPNLMGQAAPSSNASDYFVQAIGPTVKRKTTEDLASTFGCFFLGYVTGVAAGNLITTIDTSAQNTVGLGLSDVDNHITAMESAWDAFERSCVYSGYVNSGNAGLVFPVGAGSALISGLKVVNAATSLTLANNSTLFVYVDNTDGVVKSNVSFPPFPALMLYKVVTNAGSILTVVDWRRFATRNNSRDFVTVGATNSDFTTLEGAIAWGEQNRLAGEQTSFEIVIQSNITMTQRVNFTYPCIVRGAGLDGASVGSGSPKVRVTCPAGLTAFSYGVDVLPNVVFKDLYFSLSTASSSSGFFVDGFGTALGDGWSFTNCVFDGGKDIACFRFTASLAAPQGWRWDNCVWKNASHASPIPYFLVGTSSNPATGFSWRNCRFLGDTANTNTQGIQFDLSANEHLVENCEFTMGGINILARNAADQIFIERCRFKNSRLQAISLATDGEVAVSDCYFSACCSNGPSTAVIHVETISAHGGGIVTIKNNRIKNWGQGIGGIALAAGTEHRVEGNILSAVSVNVFVGILVNSGVDRVSLIDNDIDMLTGAATNGGRGGAVGLSIASSGCRIVNNRVRNAGTAGSPGAGLTVFSQSLVKGNMFQNCRGKIITVLTSASMTLVEGNLIIDSGNNDANACIDVATLADRIAVVDNIITTSGTTNPISLSVTSTNCRVGSNTTNIAPVQNSTTAPALDRGFVNSVMNVRKTYDPASTLWTASLTVEGQLINDPRYPFAGHIPRTVTLAAAVAGVQAGIRFRLTDGTSVELFNATAGPVTTDFQTAGVLTFVDGASICYAGFVVKNTNGSNTTADLGVSTYEGYIVA